MVDWTYKIPAPILGEGVAAFESPFLGDIQSPGRTGRFHIPASGSFGSFPRRLRRCLARRPCGIVGALHDPLSEFFRLISQQLSLPANEFALDAREFLRLLHPHELMRAVESIGERFFRKRQRVLANRRRLLIDVANGITGDGQQTVQSSFALG